MVKGIGIDLVSESEMKRLLDILSPGALARMFSASELAEADRREGRAMYLAERLAVKEAAFKAISPVKGGIGFDLRIIETLNRPDGSPYIARGGEIETVLAEAEASQVLVSITTEAGLAQAVVLCE